MTAETIADGDFIVFVDADDNSSKKEALADLLDVIAGTAATTGLDRDGATLKVTDLHGVGVSGNANQLLTDGGDGTIDTEAKFTFDDGVTKIGDLTSANKNLPGTDVEFYVSGTRVLQGSTGGIVGGDGVSVIGGDLVVSGALHGGAPYTNFGTVS